MSFQGDIAEELSREWWSGALEKALAKHGLKTPAPKDFTEVEKFMADVIVEIEGRTHPSEQR